MGSPIATTLSTAKAANYTCHSAENARFTITFGFMLANARSPAVSAGSPMASALSARKTIPFGQGAGVG